MTPQEKVIALREKFLFILLQAGATETYESVKQCVDVVANEVMQLVDLGLHWQFYKDVKEENENI